MKETNDAPQLTIEELESKPGLKEIRMIALVNKDDKIKATETKDSYI